MPAERRKPRPQLKTRALVASVSDAPECKAQTSSSRNTSRQNLKLSDWLTVFAYIDTHPTLSQTEVVKHFTTLKSGALVFTQPTLSRKLQERSDLEQRAHDNPSALDSKRNPRVVTRRTVSLERHQHLTSSSADLDSMADIFESGDKAIVAKVVQEMAEQNGEVINVNFDDDDESGTPDIPRGEAIHLCERLAEACLQHGDASSDLAIDLLTHLRRFRVFLRREERIHTQQTT